MYSQDYDGKLPRAWIGFPSVTFLGYARWMDVVQPYVKKHADLQLSEQHGQIHAGA